MAQPWNVLVGHFIAILSGFFAVYVIGAVTAPGFSDANHLSGLRVVAAALAVGIATWLEFITKARHPPSASTALLIALGIVDASWHTAVTFACGVALAVLIGEAMRRVRTMSDYGPSDTSG